MRNYKQAQQALSVDRSSTAADKVIRCESNSVYLKRRGSLLGVLAAISVIVDNRYFRRNGQPAIGKRRNCDSTPSREKPVPRAGVRVT
jgi:hypothetical protein